LAFVVLLAAVPTLVVGCGGKTVGEGSDGGSGASSSSGSGSADTLSCATSDMAECISVPSSLAGSCTQGTTSVSACPSSNRLGCCSITGTASNGQSATATVCYYCAGAIGAEGTSASTLSMACLSSGASPLWVAGDVASCGDGG